MAYLWNANWRTNRYSSSCCDVDGYKRGDLTWHHCQSTSWSLVRLWNHSWIVPGTNESSEDDVSRSRKQREPFGSFELKTDRFRVRRVINCTTRSSTEYKLKCCQLFRRVAVVVFQYETIDNFRTTQDKSSTNDVTLLFVVYAILQ